MPDAFIVAATRTAGGRRGGALRDWHPADLAGVVLDEVVQRSGIDPAVVEDVIMGCVGQTGEQAHQVGRNAVFASSLPDTVPAVTIDRQCGSSQQAVQFAAQAVMSGMQDVVIAAGVESMTRVPMGLAANLPQQHGHGGSAWSPKILERYGIREFNQFSSAEIVARKYGLTRDDLDGYALESHRRAAIATQAGAFDSEIVALQGLDADGAAITHTRDEGIRFNATIERMASIAPILVDGIVTPGSASQMCDGASAIMVASERAVRQHGLVPLARLHGFAVTAGDPVMMLEEPIFATRKALAKAGMTMQDIDLFEVNEAFSSIPLAWIKALEADPARTNALGGAISLGHPLGATGTKLMTTLIYALRQRGRRWGLQTMCEGGGIANVTILEAL